MSLLLLFLPFFLTAVCGAHLQYGGTSLYDSPSNVTLTVGATNQRVYCRQATGPVPTSIEWYSPQGRRVSKDHRKVVNQAAGGDRTSTLTFRSYQQSQGGAYECRVAGAGNNMERLAVCIGEHCTFLLTLKLVTCDSGVFLLPSIHHLCCVHTIQN